MHSRNTHIPSVTLALTMAICPPAGILLSREPRTERICRQPGRCLLGRQRGKRRNNAVTVVAVCLLGRAETDWLLTIIHLLADPDRRNDAEDCGGNEHIGENFRPFSFILLPRLSPPLSLSLSGTCARSSAAVCSRSHHTNGRPLPSRRHALSPTLARRPYITLARLASPRLALLFRACPHARTLLTPAVRPRRRAGNGVHLARCCSPVVFIVRGRRRLRAAVVYPYPRGSALRPRHHGGRQGPLRRRRQRLGRAQVRHEKRRTSGHPGWYAIA